MAQLFHPSFNAISRFSIVALVGFITILGWGLAVIYRSPWVTYLNLTHSQPVPFSHKHHVDGIGIDCRYCHTSVETSSFAGMPPTKTCMNCHSQIWRDSPMLEPVRASFRNGTPLRWQRVNDLPDFVFFNHSIHVAKGVGCETCHGPVNRMPLMWRAAPLTMSWCLDCHRHPEKQLRPPDQVTNMHWKKPRNQEQAGAVLVKLLHIQKLTDCYECHR